MVAKSANTALKDRIRRQAVSIYLCERRVFFTSLLKGKAARNANMKRKELERLARQHFRQESTHVQQEYISKAASQPSAAAPTTPPPSVASETRFGSSGVKRHWKPLAGKGEQLHDALLAQSPVLRSFFGDAGALETLAAATRILSVVDFEQFSEPDELKLAVLAGMAAKLTQTAPDVFKLWAKVGGPNSKPAVQKLEHKVMFVWSRTGFDPDMFD